MRKVFHISLPAQLAHIAEAVTEVGYFKTKSEFFRVVVREWIDQQLSQDISPSKFKKIIRDTMASERKNPW